MGKCYEFVTKWIDTRFTKKIEKLRKENKFYLFTVPRQPQTRKTYLSFGGRLFMLHKNAVHLFAHGWDDVSEQSLTILTYKEKLRGVQSVIEKSFIAKDNYSLLQAVRVLMSK